MSTEEDWCDLCELPKSQCVHGLPKEHPATGDWRPLLGVIILAKKDGECPVCGDPIEAGKDQIGVILEDEERNHEYSRWAHYGCGR